MDNPNDTPDSQPPIISDGEVDRLLRQAETLAHDIVEDVGLDPETLEASRSPSGQLGGPEPDPVAAVELVAQDVAQLRESLDAETAVADEPLPDSRSSDSPTLESPESEESISAETYSADATATEASTDPDELVLVNYDGAQPPSAVLVEANLTSTDESESTDSAILENAADEASAESPVDHAQDVTGAPDEAAAARDEQNATADASAGEQPAPEASPTTDESVVPTPIAPTSLPRKVLRGGKYVGREAVVSVSNGFMRIIILLDKPFAWVPASAKLALAIVGIISLIMGGVAVVLPKMTQHNPYALMEPLPHKEEPAKGAAHGENKEQGEKKESGHEEPAHAEPAPAQKSGGGH